jgi:hypothetical protein
MPTVEKHKLVSIGTAPSVSVRGAVERHMIDEHRGRAGRVRQHHERLRIWNQADLPDRAHARHRLQLIERVHCLHRNSESDARLHTLGELLDEHTLPANDAPVVAVEEAHEANPRLVAPRHDRLGRSRCHAGQRTDAAARMRDGLPAALTR